MGVENKATERIMEEVKAIINTPLPVGMLDTVKRFVEIVSILQGQIEGLSDAVIDLDVRMRRVGDGQASHNAR